MGLIKIIKIREDDIMPPEKWEDNIFYSLLNEKFYFDVKKKAITPEDIIKQDNKDYYNMLQNLESEINKALETGNKELFMKLSKEYKMLLD